MAHDIAIVTKGTATDTDEWEQVGTAEVEVLRSVGEDGEPDSYRFIVRCRELLPSNTIDPIAEALRGEDDGQDG